MTAHLFDEPNRVLLQLLWSIHSGVGIYSGNSNADSSRSIISTDFSLFVFTVCPGARHLTRKWY